MITSKNIKTLYNRGIKVAVAFFGSIARFLTSKYFSLLCYKKLEVTVIKGWKDLECFFF